MSNLQTEVPQKIQKLISRGGGDCHLELESSEKLNFVFERKSYFLQK